MSDIRSPKNPKAFAAAWRTGSSQTLADLVAGRGAHPLRGLSAFYWIAAWGVFVEANGREPASVDEVVESLRIKRSTAFNWQKAFREIFPEYSTPATLWAIANEQVHGTDPKTVGMQLGGVEL